MRSMKWWIPAVAAFLLAAVPAAGATFELEAPAPIEIQAAGFELERVSLVSIDAQGLAMDRRRANRGWSLLVGDTWIGGERDQNLLGCYAWILDATTREPVWILELEEADRGEAPNHRRTKTELELPAGRYEIYLYGGHASLVHEARSRVGDDSADSADSADIDDSAERELQAVRKELQSCYIRVEVESSRRFEPNGKFDDALIAMNGLGDSEFRRQAFELDRDAELQLYGMLESGRGRNEPSDYGWIADLATGERVWDMSDRRGRHAGGAAKNRLLDRTVRLRAGRYLLVYGTDDSHSAQEFNAAPPFDPMAWGVQLRPGKDFDRSGFRLVDTPVRPAPHIDFSRAGDAKIFEQNFRLPSTTTLHIFALGESTDGGWTWADRGWILEAPTRETVWEMDGRNTSPAGGAAKNRMFDGRLTLPAGEYVAIYLTDGSHSFERWNAAAPFEPQAWGMQIAADPAGKLELIDARSADKPAGMLVDLTRVRDDETRTERFSLDVATEVEIYAVGEGRRNEMFDRGLLRATDDGRTVWEMDYRETEHAGGSQKNRAVRTRLRLDPGEYEAVFETDDSHAFGDWNEDAPDDPLSWGMTVRVVR